MKQLPPIPNALLRKHNLAFFDSIRTALDSIVNGSFPVFPRRSNSFTLSSSDIANLTTIRDLFVRRKLLTATAEQIREIVNTGVPTSSSFSNDAFKLLQELFNYSEFQQGRTLVICRGKFYWKTPETPWGGYEYLKYHTSTLKYCPYCNADTVYAFEKANKRNVASALDHFYPKSEYPFLALSLYNLIPVCSRCNSQMKGPSDMTKIANPYIEDIHKNVIFFPVIEKSQPPLDKPCSIVILPRKGCDQKAIEYVRLFELERLYSSAFARDAWLCMEKMRLFTPEFRQDLARRIKQDDPQLIESLLFGMPLDESEINKTRLGKMQLDITELFQRHQGGLPPLVE